MIDNNIELPEESFHKLSNLLGGAVGMATWTEQQLGSATIKEVLSYEGICFYHIKGKL